MKVFLARIFKLPLVAVEFGYSMRIRVLRRNPEGAPYVMICGEPVTFHQRTVFPILNCRMEDLK